MENGSRKEGGNPPSGVEVITKGVFLKSVSTFLVVFFGFLMSVILNKVYGKDLYGYLVLVFSITSFCVGIVDLGARQTINRFVPRYFEKKEGESVRGLLTVSFTIFGIALIVFAALIFFFSRFIATNIFSKPQMYTLLKTGTLFFIGVSLSEFLSEIFQALQDWKKEALVSAGYPLLYLALSVIAIFLLKLNIEAVLWANFLASLIVAAVALAFLRKKFRFSISVDSFRFHASSIFNFGLPLILVNFNFYLLMWFDKMVMGKFRSSAELAYYYIAFTFFNALTIFFKVLFIVLRPYFSGLSVYLENKVLIKNRFQLLFRWFLHSSVLAGIASFFFIAPFIRLFYGASYQPSIDAFRMLLIVFLIRSMVQPMGIFMINVFGNTRLSAVLGTVLVVVTMLFDMLLIPLYGYQGAIYATIIGYLVWWVLTMVFFKQFAGMMSYPSLIKTSAACFIAALLYAVSNMAFHINELVLGTALAVLYIAALIVMREIDKNDIDILKRSFGIIKKAIFLR